MNDILCFAEFAKRSFCENIIDAAGDASIGMAIADENRGQSSARIHAAGYRALAHPALHFARSVGVWKRQGQTVAAEEEMIGEDRYRRTDLSHGVADGVIESVADDGQLRERAHLAHELREEAIDHHRLEKLPQHGAAAAHQGELRRHALLRIDLARHPPLLDPPPLGIGKSLQQRIDGVGGGTRAIKVNDEEHQDERRATFDR